MTIITTILAEGIPPGVLFAAAIAIVVAIANAVAKKKQDETTQEKMRSQRHSRENRSHQADNRQREADDRENRRAMDRDQTLMETVREQIRRQQSPQGQMPREQAQTRGRKKGKQRPASVPPPMPGIRAVSAMPKPVEAEPAIASVSRSGVKSETARNVRMLLQPAGIREAFILAEVLGKPKALRDD